MEVFVDLQLGALIAMLFSLSFIKAKIILKLPKVWQPAWSLVAVNGIAFVITLVTVFCWMVRPTSVIQAWFDLVLVFLAALPGMIYLNHRQWQRSLKKDKELAQGISELTIKYLKEETQYENN